jgi:hypothetical protein
MKLDPKLLALLDAAARGSGRNVNELLAEKLGVCPTCGQAIREPRASPRQRKPSPKAAAILEWRKNNPGGAQNACARDLHVSQAYVGRVWHEADENGRGRNDETGREG